MHLNLKEKAPPLSSKAGESGGGLKQECQSSDALHQSLINGDFDGQ